MQSVLEIKQGEMVRFIPACEIMWDIPQGLTLKQLELIATIGGREALVSQVYTSGRPVEQVGYPFFTVVGAPGLGFKAKWAKKVILQPGQKRKLVYGRKISQLTGR